MVAAIPLVTPGPARCNPANTPEPPMPRPKPLAEAEAVLKDFALKFPEATEDHPWDHIAIKVKGKVFVFLAGPEGALNVTCKLPSSGRLALALPFAAPTGYGLGKSGWVTASFGPDAAVPLDRMAEWIEESYRAVAPKKLVAAWDNPDAAAVKPAKKAPAKKRKK
jgi:predicted DNA-binding protein (MmcQ/YjbR family)